MKPRATCSDASCCWWTTAELCVPPTDADCREIAMERGETYAGRDFHDEHRDEEARVECGSCDPQDNWREWLV